MTKYVRMQVHSDATEEVLAKLKDIGRYSEDLFYRVFTLDGDPYEITEKINQIRLRGTDRISDNFRKNGRYVVFNLDKKEDLLLEARGRPLKPSEYVWLAREEGFGEQIRRAESPDETLFVSVYDPKQMILIDGDGSCFEFRDKQKPQDALIALLELYYK